MVDNAFVISGALSWGDPNCAADSCTKVDNGNITPFFAGCPGDALTIKSVDVSPCDGGHGDVFIHWVDGKTSKSELIWPYEKTAGDTGQSCGRGCGCNHGECPCWLGNSGGWNPQHKGPTTYKLK
jgi:hypothetical protein